MFSVASGLQYERLLRIMMASARRHASLPLKFYFLAEVCDGVRRCAKVCARGRERA